MLKIIFFFNLFLVAYMQSPPQNNDTETPTLDTDIQRGYLNSFAVHPILSHKHRLRPKFHPAWMDFCDPYHCNDYRKNVCGLNRKTMTFKIFESGCHIILNNQCSTYRGTLKYDLIELKYCKMYVMYLRMGCPTDCRAYDVDPVCAVSSTRGHTVVFINKCSLEMANCRNNLTEIQEYDVVKMELCEYLLRQQIKS